jgi:dipeptidyl aminopeptidase/acylaminoacyl peptidase
VPLYIIHGAQDELFDVEDVRKAYNEMKGKGANVRLVIAEYLSHYQAASYTSLLKGSIPWLEEIWAK